MITQRIVLIRNAQPYDFGGGERFPVFVAEQLKKLNFEPIVVSRSTKLIEFASDYSVSTIRGWWWRWQNWSGWRVVFLPIYVLWLTAIFLWYFQLFRRLSPEVIHIQSKDDFIAATLAAKALGLRVVWTDHADLKHIWCNVAVWYKNPIGKLVYLVAHKADAITVVSKSEQALVTANLPRSSRVSPKIKVVYNGVIDSSETYATVASTQAFCIASRLVKDKGISEAIAAFREVSDSHPKVSLTIIGDGPDKNLFKRQAKNLAGITFMGYQKNPLPEIAKAAIFIHPTHHEGFSVALVEASMLKKAIIATDVGGNPEIIKDGKTGLLVPPKDSESLARAMKKLLENTPLVETLGSNAYRQYKKQFEFSKIVKEQFLPLYGVSKL